MRFSKTKLAIFAAWTICAQSTARPQSAKHSLQPLVETSAQRLLIAERVALAKWDSGMPVEDRSREAQIIEHAITAGESKGLNQAAVSNFFRAQIEANKLIQYSLLAEWRRAGKAPDHKSVNLPNAIRPELDQLETALIEELAKTEGIRASASCHSDVAKAVGTFVSSTTTKFSPLRRIALDRALAAACTD